MKNIVFFVVHIGSVAAHLSVLSPAASGLFQRAIMASGAAVNPWAITFSSHFDILQELGMQNIGFKNS